MKIISFVVDKEKVIPIDEFFKSHPKKFTRTKKSVDGFIKILNSFLIISGISLQLKRTNIKQRTSAQNSAYWLWLTWIVEMLEAENVYPKSPLGSEIEWTKEVLHYSISHPLIFKEFGKVSTTKLTTTEIDFIVDRYVETFRDIMELPKFPSIESKLIYESYGAR